MESRRLVIPLFVIAATVVLTILLLNKPKVVEEPPVIVVRTASVSAELPQQTIQLSGTTQSAETSVLRFQVAGRVSEKMVRLGDHLEAGDPIAIVYNPELEPIRIAAENTLAKAIAETEQAERDFNRVEALFRDQAVTQQEWETARTQLTANNKAKLAAQANLDRATQVSNESTLIAPFAGSVTDIMIDVGEVIRSGAPAVRLSNPNAVELKLALSDAILQQLELGQAVQVQPALHTDATSINGVISEISPYRERGSLPEIIVSLDADKIGPGVAVNARFDVRAKRGLGIPMRTVLMTGDNTVAVYRVEDGVANLVPIRPISINTENVVIEQGLNTGDVIVVEGLSQLYDGANVVEATTSFASGLE